VDDVKETWQVTRNRTSQRSVLRGTFTDTCTLHSDRKDRALQSRKKLFANNVKSWTSSFFCKKTGDSS